MATIAENLQTIIDIKADIKTAIENKGVDMTNTPFSEYSTKIDEITTGGGTGKIDVAATGIKFGNSTFVEIPDIFDFDGVTNFENMFAECNKVKQFPFIDTSKVTTFKYAFGGCAGITTIPNLDTSSATIMYNMFSYCTNLTNIPELNTEKVTNFYGMFQRCGQLTTIPQLNTSICKDCSYMFNYCAKLTTLPILDLGSATNTNGIMGYGDKNLLTDIGGFKNLKTSMNGNFLENAPNLTIESLMNVINNLWDWSGNTDGYAPLNDGTNHKFGTTHKLKFGQTNLDKLTPEQVAVATAKGWTLTA